MSSRSSLCSQSAPKTQPRYQPYGQHQRAGSSSKNLSNTLPSTAPSTIPIVSSVPASPNNLSSPETLRDAFMARAGSAYPDFTPRNDFDVLAIGVGNYKGPSDGIHAWLDQEFNARIKCMGTASNVLRAAKEVLDRRCNITGRKPREPGTAGVFVRPIPHSSYSLRLFPGSPRRQEYCMDFVCTKTGEPVNSPFKFELWSMPNPTSLQPSTRMESLEETWGRKHIRAGEEKFVLRDGTTYILKRPGLKTLRFKVPTRIKRVDDVPGMDSLEFPDIIQI